MFNRFLFFKVFRFLLLSLSLCLYKHLHVIRHKVENQVTKWLKRAKKEKRTKQITNSQKSQTKSRNQTKIIQWALASSSSSRRVAIGFRLAGGLDRLGALARLKCILVVCQFVVADAFKIYINKKCAPKMGIRHRQHIVYRVSHIAYRVYIQYAYTFPNFGDNFLQFD